MPISELVFGVLTQNRSSLEPSLGFPAIAGTPHIVDHARYAQPPEEPMLDPKTLWRLRPDVNGVPVAPPLVAPVGPREPARLGRLTAFLMSKPGAYLKLDGNGAWWCDPPGAVVQSRYPGQPGRDVQTEFSQFDPILTSPC